MSEHDEPGGGAESTLRLEVSAAKRNMPEFAWPTVLLTLVLLGSFTVSTWLALAAHLPLWLAAGINTFAIYAIYTPLHDATHSAIVPRAKRWRWVNTAVGIAAAIPLWMFFHPHRKSHFIHHARTNQPEDPDLWAKGSFTRVLCVQVPWMLLGFFNPVALYRECVRLKLKPRERRLTMALFAAYSAIVLGVIAAGHGRELVVLWLIPWFTGMLIMQTMFGWAPHHDHSETGRYRNTRISLWPGAELLTLQQNLHLIHHMLPAVPFYRYRAVFDEIRPILERHQARIEGFWPTPGPVFRPA